MEVGGSEKQGGGVQTNNVFILNHYMQNYPTNSSFTILIQKSRLGEKIFNEYCLIVELPIDGASGTWANSNLWPKNLKAITG